MVLNIDRLTTGKTHVSYHIVAELSQVKETFIFNNKYLKQQQIVNTIRSSRLNHLQKGQAQPAIFSIFAAERWTARTTTKTNKQNKTTKRNKISIVYREGTTE